MTPSFKFRFSSIIPVFSEQFSFSRWSVFFQFGPIAQQFDFDGALDQLDYPLEKLPYFTPVDPTAAADGRVYVEGKGAHYVFRPDTKRILGPVGSAYEIVTNRQAFEVLKPLGSVSGRIPVRTVRLDDIAEIPLLDMLKIDIQGGELAVFRSGISRLSQAVAIQTEISFVSLYKGQPSLGDVDLELRGQGFIPHCFAAIKHWPIAPCVIKGDPREPLRQLLEADLVYVRDFSRPERMTDEQLKHLALVAHYCYGSIDLALRCVMLLEQRNVFRAGAQQHYLQHCLE
jgi:hypothetical protein